MNPAAATGAQWIAAIAAAHPGTVLPMAELASLDIRCMQGYNECEMRREEEREYSKSKEGRSGRAASLLRAVLIGVTMSLIWGALNGALHLERLFPDTVSGELFSQPLTVQIALYGLISPLLEEMLFRWFLFNLTCKIMPCRFAAFAVSALFALWHGNVIQMLYAFPAGLILQALRAQSGRMGEPVLCHMSANLTAIAVSAFVS